MKLFVDDERPAPDGWELVTDFREAVRRIDDCRVAGEPFDGLSLDHDLGGDDTTRPIIRYLCEEDYWPTVLRIHTANPVGREYLAGMARRYGPATMKVIDR